MNEYDIVTIFEDCLWAVQRPGCSADEYVLAFRNWHDLDAITEFFNRNKDCMKNPIWTDAGLDPEKPEKSAQRVIDEANELETHIKRLCENAIKEEKPDLDGHFKPLEGKRYEDMFELVTHKSYGPNNPSLLRLYAIRFYKNQYLVVASAIKLGDSIQNSPGMYPKIFNQIDDVIDFLKRNGICESEDL